MHKTLMSKTRLATAISMATMTGLSIDAIAQEETSKSKPTLAVEEILVTSARREQSVLDIPMNISAVSAEKIEELRLDDISKIAAFVPGLTVIDRGPRNESEDIFVRGLNTTALGPGFEGGTVATYLGDIPLNIDLYPADLERVEVLIGPQGTLYGQGTMGGAIRYIPNEANLNEFTGEVRGDVNKTAESSGTGYIAGATLNIPLVSDVLALRLTADYKEDPGFIDYNYVVRESGVSDPEPDFSDPDAVAANLRQVEDANGEETLAGRANLRWMPTDTIDVNLWYYYQDTKAEGRQISNEVSFGTGPYESALRYEEPNDYTNELLSLDVAMDLGFAEATLIYGQTNFEGVGQRDQTDLLLGFEYGYEAFPTFSAYTREEDEQESSTLEFRLVSQHEGPVQYVVGFFANEFTQDAVSLEFTPGYDEFIIDSAEDPEGLQLRPDSLEYIQLTKIDETEQAFFGELSWDILDSLTATFGYRLYSYDVNNQGGFGLPLADTLWGGADPDEINVDLGENSGDDEGDTIKVNLAWEFYSDGMAYITYSEGYRKGGVNIVPECTPEQLASTDQKLCAQEDEVLIDPDTIKNYELGFKGRLLDDRMSISAALYYIDWEDIQVDTSTEFGSLPITGNGSKARSQGLEFQGSWLLTDRLTANLTYAYTDAKLTEDADGLLAPFTVESGARLPGHATHQGTFNLKYSQPIAGGMDMDLDYTLIYMGGVYNGIGGPEDPLYMDVFDDDGNFVETIDGDRGYEEIPAYDLHSISATFSKDAWTAQLYVDNLLDDLYYTGTRVSRRDGSDGETDPILADEQNGPGAQFGDFTLRSYGYYVGRPRTVGVRFTYAF